MYIHAFVNRVEVGMLEVLGLVEDLHDEGDGGDVSHIGGIGGDRTAGDDAADAVEDVSDARPGVPYGRERARFLVDGYHWPLPRLHILAGKIGAGERRNIVRLADDRTSLGAVLEDDQARLAGTVEHRRP
jgi:hypothetical protein